MTDTARPARNFYGRLKGKALKDSQKRYLAEDLAGLSPGARRMGRQSRACAT